MPKFLDNVKFPYVEYGDSLGGGAPITNKEEEADVQQIVGVTCELYQQITGGRQYLYLSPFYMPLNYYNYLKQSSTPKAERGFRVLSYLCNPQTNNQGNPAYYLYNVNGYTYTTSNSVNTLTGVVLKGQIQQDRRKNVKSLVQIVCDWFDPSTLKINFTTGISVGFYYDGNTFTHAKDLTDNQYGVNLYRSVSVFQTKDFYDKYLYYRE